MNWLKMCRRCIELLVILLFCSLPWLNRHGIESLKGSLFAFDFFHIPFADPATALQALAGGAYIGNWPLATVCVGALAALFIAFFLGRIFCGWLCPYGFFSEIIYHLRQKFPFRVPEIYPLMAKFPELFPLSLALSFSLKGLVLVLGLAAIFFFAFPFIMLISMPGELSLLPLIVWQASGFASLISSLLLPLGALIAEFIFGKRLWCRYVCPQSIMLGLFSWAIPKGAPGLRIAWRPKKCACDKISPCRQACTLDLNPRQIFGPSRRDCMMCGDCVSTCQRYGQALEWSLKHERPKRKVHKHKTYDFKV